MVQNVTFIFTSMAKLKNRDASLKWKSSNVLLKNPHFKRMALKAAICLDLFNYDLQGSYERLIWRKIGKSW